MDASYASIMVLVLIVVGVAGFYLMRPEKK
jgi:hypothetical protein